MRTSSAQFWGNLWIICREYGGDKNIFQTIKLWQRHVEIEAQASYLCRGHGFEDHEYDLIGLYSEKVMTISESKVK